MATKTHRQTAEAPVRKAGANGSAPMSRVLTFADIIAAPDVQYELVETPEWGGSTRIASLDGAARQALVSGMRADQKEYGDEVALLRFAFRVVIGSIVDEHGEHIEDQDAALAQIEAKNMAPVQRVFDACRRLSGLGQDELDQRLEDLKANPSASSPTD